MPVFTEPFFNTTGHNPSILLTWVTIIWFLFCINDYYWFFRQGTRYYEILIYYVIASFVREAWKVTEYRI